MSNNVNGIRTVRDRLIDAWSDVRRSFNEFLLIPTLMVSSFLALAIALHLLDRADLGWLDPLRSALKGRLFIDSEATSDFLSAIAGGIISVTSITISLLLIAVQQGAGSLTSAVFDQFLRRRRNQAYFGYFIGLALYSLVTLSTVHESSNAVLGATLGFAFTVAALYILIVLLYSTINQMRPAIIVAAIHDRTLDARRRQLNLLHRTRRVPTLTMDPCRVVQSERNGFVTRIDLDALAQALGSEGAPVEITLHVSMGSFVACNDPLAEIRGGTDDSRCKLSDAVRRALVIERLRDIDNDPAYGVSQLERIGWTTISSAKSSPGSGAHAIRALRDLMARWAEGSAVDPSARILPVVYTDTVFGVILDTLESLAIASVESMQHQSYVQVLRALSTTVERLPAEERFATIALIERITPLIGEHIGTSDMAVALRSVSTALAACHHPQAAAHIGMAKDKLGRRVVEL